MIATDILFHRYFQEPRVVARNPDSMNRDYRGKADLCNFESDLQEQFIDMQEVINSSLRTRGGINLDGQPAYYFDFIDAVLPNAIAFPYMGVRFIGITVPLLNELLRRSSDISSDPAVLRRLSVHKSQSSQPILSTAFLASALMFVVFHEYSHHDLGHQEQWDPDGKNEVLESHASNLDGQAKEIHADGLGAMLCLQNLVGGVLGDAVLRQRSPSSDSQDEFLLWLGIISIGTFFLTRHSSFNAQRIYTLSHPPPAARMSLVMKNLENWSRNHRPSLLPSINTETYKTVMREVAFALGQRTFWVQEDQFLKSPEGSRYFEDLSAALKREKARFT